MTDQRTLKKIIADQRAEIIVLKQQLKMERLISAEFGEQIHKAKSFLTGVIPEAKTNALIEEMKKESIVDNKVTKEGSVNSSGAAFSC